MTKLIYKISSKNNSFNAVHSMVFASLIREFCLRIYDRGGKPFKQRWVGFIQEPQRLPQIPAVYIKDTIYWQFYHISDRLQTQIIALRANINKSDIIISKDL